LREAGLHGFVLLGALLALFLGVELQRDPSAFDTLQCRDDISLNPPGRFSHRGNQQEANHRLLGMEKETLKEVAEREKIMIGK
jgi:hypothetical protein